MTHKVPGLSDDLAEFFDKESWPLPSGYRTASSEKNKEETRFQNYQTDRIAERMIIEGCDVQKASKLEAGRSFNTNKPRHYERLALRRAAHVERLRISAENVLQEYARCAFFDIRNLFDDEGNPLPLSELDDDTAAAISGIDIQKMGKTEGWAEVVKYKVNDKLKALDALAKRLNLFADHNKTTIGGEIEIHQMSKTERARRVAFLLGEAIKEKEATTCRKK